MTHIAELPNEFERFWFEHEGVLSMSTPRDEINRAIDVWMTKRNIELESENASYRLDWSTKTVKGSTEANDV